MCSRKQIDLLFQKNSSSTAYPIKAVYIKTDVEMVFPVQAMFVVPKRNFKKAHDRNKLKRRMREVYRLNKNSFYESFKAEDQKMIMAFIYTSKKSEEYPVIETAITKILNGVVQKKKS